LGSLAETLGPKTYLDANFFIYAVEEVAPWAGLAKDVLTLLDRGLCTAVTSELSLAECLVKPLELRRMEIAKAYLGLLQDRRSLAVVPISRALLVEAAQLRAFYRIKLPDAIHAATALHRACSSFLTNDSRLKIPGLRVLGWRDLETFVAE
jgi:predicted nucleic acid-binding protein